ALLRGVAGGAGPVLDPRGGGAAAHPAQARRSAVGLPDAELRRRGPGRGAAARRRDGVHCGGGGGGHHAAGGGGEKPSYRGREKPGGYREYIPYFAANFGIRPWEWKYLTWRDFWVLKRAADAHLKPGSRE